MLYTLDTKQQMDKKYKPLTNYQVVVIENTMRQKMNTKQIQTNQRFNQSANVLIQRSEISELKYY